jgi:hypothetical protein
MRFHFSRSLVSLCLSTAMLSTGTFSWSQNCIAQEPQLQSPPRLAALMLAEIAPQPVSNQQLPARSGPAQLLGEDLPSANSTRSDNALTPLQNRKLALPVQVVDLSVADLGTGILPESAAEKQEKQTHMVRSAAYKTVQWRPGSICHYPLRFEETMLERHGHVRFGCWQPLASGVRFFATIPVLPYLSTLRPPYDPVYNLGTHRPGSSAPLLRDSIPYDKHAAVAEALAMAGFFWAMPM